MIPSIPEIFPEEKIIHVAEFIQRRWLEESGQCLENADRTHLVLASDKASTRKKLSIVFRSSGGVRPLIIIVFLWDVF